MTQYFKAAPSHYSRDRRVSGLAVTLLFPLLAPGFALLFLPSQAYSFRGLVIALAMGLVPPLLVLPEYFKETLGYRVSGRQVEIQRRIGTVRVVVQGAELVPPQASKALRLRSVFGTSGRDVRYNFGSYRMYATRRDGVVLLRCPDGRVYVTPDDPQEFVTAIELAVRV